MPGCTLVLALALGCSSGGGTTDPNPPDPDPDPAAVAAVEVTPDDGLLEVDDVSRLLARVTDAEGTVLTDRTVTWISLDDEIATVSATGDVSALTYGDARIVGATEGKSDTVVVHARLRFTQISVGRHLTCGLTASGAAWCWGLNRSGMLGAGLTVPSSAVPVRVADGHVFTTITVGGGHACGLDEDLGAWCWGENFGGVLGDGVPSGGVNFPSRVVGNHRFLAISAGAENTCALDESRLAYCWGFASKGLIPGRPLSSANFPVAIASPGTPQPITFESIKVGSNNACGVATEIDHGELWCWGENSAGQILSAERGPRL